MKFATSMIVALAIMSAATSARAQSVTVTGGEIRGAMLEKGSAVFKGIPYAAPPVGELRWREPMPVEAWSGVRDATAFGAICAQPSTFNLKAAELSKEDCLFLNVRTAEWPSRSLKPVMVWIHGGGNYAGESSAPVFDNDSLAQRGIVLVTANYRLGWFGFFSHPALTRESPNHASGNQGLLDQIAVLKWVQDNIARFGGDPDNVTLFGGSAGSLDVNVLMTSPLAKGLFQKVIGQSGTVMLLGDPLTRLEAERRGETLAARWSVRADASLKELRDVPAADILKSHANPLADVGPSLGITVDGYVLPKRPAQVFASGEQHRVPLLLGSVARERLVTRTTPISIEDAYGPLAKRAHTLYDGRSDALYGSPEDQWATDITFRCTAVAQHVWHAAAGNTGFQYEFARVPRGRESVGATHASDAPYVFGSLDKFIFDPAAPAALGPRAQADAVDAQISDVIQQYWVNFAKTGDPNGPRLPVWPKFDPAKRDYIQFTDNGPIAKESLRRPYCDLFIENVKRLMMH